MYSIYNNTLVTNTSFIIFWLFRFPTYLDKGDRNKGKAAIAQMEPEPDDNSRRGAKAHMKKVIDTNIMSYSSWKVPSKQTPDLNFPSQC
jgi:hypothetical protein